MDDNDRRLRRFGHTDAKERVLGACAILRTDPDEVDVVGTSLRYGYGCSGGRQPLPVRQIMRATSVVGGRDVSNADVACKPRVDKFEFPVIRGRTQRDVLVQIRTCCSEYIVLIIAIGIG